MGSYGIGPGRVIGTIVEHLADDKGLVWPTQIAPYKVYLSQLGTNPDVTHASESLYKQLTSSGVGVIYDDRQEPSAGEKFADADLMGIPIRLVVSDKTVLEKSCEIKERTASEVKLLPLAGVIQALEK
jgi:prolyl-tRNA synthetase